MPTPTRQITGTFKDSHLQPAAGKIVKFTAQTYRTDTVNKIRIDLNAVEVTLDSNGQIPTSPPFTLVCTDATGVAPTPVAYRVVEKFGSRATYWIDVPTGSGALDMADIAPLADPPAQPDVYASLEAMQAGDAATLTAAEAYTDAHSSTGAVSSVYGRTGAVTAQTGDYTKAQVGLGNVDNTSDANKPVSTAQAAADALALKAASNLSDVANASTVRTNLGLGSAATHPSTDFDTAGAAATAQTAAVATAAAYTDTETARAQAAEAAITAGLKFKAAAVAATSNVASLTGLPTTDSVTLTDGQIILLTGQSSGSQNGLWAVHSGAWTRPTNFAAGSDATATSVYVEAGTVNATSTWVVAGTTNNVVGTNVLTFQQASGLGEVTAGTALSKSGNTLNVVLGATGSTAAAGNDSRLSDARTPLGHHATHSTGGSDPIAPGDIGAAPVSTTTIDLVDRTNNTTETVPAGTTTNCSTAGVTKTAPALDNPVATPPKRFSIKNLSTGNITVAYPDQAGVAQSLTVLPAETRTFRQKSVSGWGVESGAIAIATLDGRFVPKDTNSGLVPDTAMSPRWKVPKAQGAVCFTFDDGYSYYDSIRQIMNANGQRGTFYISSDYIDGGGAKITSAQLLALANDGHEIGDHGKTHSNLTGVAASTLAAELDTSKTTIEAIVGAGKVNTFAYPFGATGRNTTLDLEVASRYFSARSVANFVGDGQPMFLFRSDRPGEMTPLIAAYPWGTNYPGDSDNTRSHANVLNYIRLAAKHPVIFIVLAHDPVAVGPPTDVQIQQALNLAASLGVPCLTVSEAFGNSTPILDPGFEDTTMAAWIKQGTAAETANIVTDTALTGYYGSTSLHLNVANIANNVYVSQAVPVIPGRAITFGGHAKVVGLSAGAPGLVPRLRWKNFDGTTTINSTNGTALTSANNGAAYAPISVTATPPVNCAYAQLDWLLNGVTGDAYVSHCFLQGNEAGAFG